MNVEFYIPQSQRIPTELRLKVDGKQVTYHRLYPSGCEYPGRFGYDFYFYSGETVEEAMDITKELAEIMCWQSYDHGSQWRITSMEPVQQNDRYKIGEIIRVLFRVRDSY